MKKLLLILTFILGLTVVYGQNFNLCGIWYSNESQCPQSVFHYETFSISQDSASYVIATKIIGDSCVTSGHVCFYGTYNSSPFIVGVWLGSPSQPNYIPVAGQLNVIDSTHLLLLIQSETINIYKYTCHELDSLGLQPSDYGLPCNCDVGVNEIMLMNIISIFPNPFTTQTTLQTNKFLKCATLTIYNTFGQQVEQIKNISGQTIILQRDNLPSGLYFLQLAQDNIILTQDKLIIIDN